MTLRLAKERVLQTLIFEIGGLLIATPLYSAVSGQTVTQSAGIILAVSIAVLLWSPFHNWLFDLAEWHCTARVASARPHNLRLLHALSHEVSVLIVTLPLMLVLTGYNLGEALMVNFGLTALYTAYAYVFHIVYDRLRPIRPAPPKVAANMQTALRASVPQTGNAPARSTRPDRLPPVILTSPTLAAAPYSVRSAAREAVPRAQPADMP